MAKRDSRAPTTERSPREAKCSPELECKIQGWVPKSSAAAKGRPDLHRPGDTELRIASRNPCRPAWRTRIAPADDSARNRRRIGGRYRRTHPPPRLRRDHAAAVVGHLPRLH